MNTDITAAVKPEYPVVDRNPPFTKTVANFNTLDYLRLTTITGVSVAVGYLSGIKPNIRGPSMVTGGLIGLMGGFMYAYQNSAGRLMGFFPNDGEVARYKRKQGVSFPVNMEVMHDAAAALKVPMAGEMAAIPDDQQATPIPGDRRWDDHEVATLTLLLLCGSPVPTDLDAHDDGLLGSLDVAGAIWPDEHYTDLQTGGHATGLPAEFTDEMVVQQLALLNEVVEEPAPLRLPLPPGSQQQQLQQQKAAAAAMEPAPMSNEVVGNGWKRLKMCVTDNPVVVEEEEVGQMVPGTELHPEEEHWGLLIREKTRGC